LQIKKQIKMTLPKANLKKTDYGFILEFNSEELDISINELANTERTKMKVRDYVSANGILLENSSDFDFLNESYNYVGLEPINEMDLFDVERRDLITTKEFLKASETASKVIPAGKTYFKKRLKNATRPIVRDGLHKHEAFDSLYHAVGILEKQPGKKPKKRKKK